MKTLKTFSNLAEAGFAHSLLEAAGLHPVLADEHTGGYTPVAALGMRLQIDEAEYEQALRVLAEGPDAEPPDGPNPMAAMATDPRASGRFPTAVFVAVAVGFVALCYIVTNELRTRTHSTADEEVRTRDSNDDGKPDVYWYYRWGKVVRYEADRNFDRKIDAWYFYNFKGVIERSEEDENYDGILDHWYDYIDGVPMACRIDTDLNGIPDFFGTYRNGVLVECDIRPNDTSVVTRRQFYKLGFLREEWVDEDVDGKFDYRIEFDPFGKPSKHLPMVAEK